jgi:hypothetical protein
MTLTILIVAFGVLVLLLLVYTTRRRAADVSQYDSLTQQLVPVPIEALLNLIDPAQQDYLERMLPRRDFLRLQRIRNRALLVYVRAIYKNAGILLKCAHAAAESTRVEIAEAGRELSDMALFTRTQALRSIVVLAISLVVPNAAANLVPVVAKYVTATARSTSLAALLSQQSAIA